MSITDRPHPMDAPLSSGRERRSRSRSRSRPHRRRSRDRFDARGGHYHGRDDRGGNNNDRYDRYRPDKRDRYRENDRQRDDDRHDRREDRRDDHRDPRPRDGTDRRGPPPSQHLPIKRSYRINASAPPDTKVEHVVDPRGSDPANRITKKARGRGNGRNTESFDPADTLVRPDLRVWVGNREGKEFDKKLKHDDVVIVPELFGPESDWSLYYTLVEEMTQLQKSNRSAEWISWHEGAHLISKNPQGCPTFERVIDRLCEYFRIRKKSIGTRFNWYRDSTDWKPFHHDSAAFNPARAKTQNITVGVSFGACRELAFIRAVPQPTDDKVKIYFPQTNNGVFSFGRDVNILWKHGVNALSEEEQDGKGRISIILWGLAEGVVEEEGSPALLGSDGVGPHAARRDGRGQFHGRNHGRR